MTLRPDRHPSLLLFFGGILLVSIVGLIGALLARSHDRLIAANRELSRAQAAASAEAGLAVAIERLRRNGTATLSRPFGERGAFTVQPNRVGPGRTVELVSRGTCGAESHTLVRTVSLD